MPYLSHLKARSHRERVNEFCEKKIPLRARAFQGIFSILEREISVESFVGLLEGFRLGEDDERKWKNRIYVLRIVNNRTKSRFLSLSGTLLPAHNSQLAPFVTRRTRKSRAKLAQLMLRNAPISRYSAHAQRLRQRQKDGEEMK